MVGDDASVLSTGWRGFGVVVAAVAVAGPLASAFARAIRAASEHGVVNYDCVVLVVVDDEQQKKTELLEVL